MKIVLLGSVNPLDFDLSQEDYNRVSGLKFGRSVPVSDLAITLVQLGHEVTVIGIVMTADSVVSLKTQNGVNLIYVLGRRQEKLKAITFYSVERKSILSQIASINPDIVNAHWTYEYAIRVRSRSSENFVFVSDYIRMRWNQRMFVSSGEVIPNMNRLSIVKSNESARVNNVISVGNTNRRKNIRGLLAAWQMVVLTNPNLRLHIVGPGLGAGDSMAKEFDSKFEYGQVTWHGTITRHELSDLYSRCKVLVHPSLHESFGLIYLEAFASNLGVIAFEKSGSAREVMGNAGLILKDSSLKSLADAILNLTSNQTLLNQLTENGRARLEKYSPNLVSRMYISLYERTLGALN